MLYPKEHLKGASHTATTYLKRHKISKGDSIAKSLKDRFDYGMNPDKTQEGELISSYECDHMTADAEFLLAKAKYRAITGREQRGESDVLCYQIRQSFNAAGKSEAASEVLTNWRRSSIGAVSCVKIGKRGKNESKNDREAVSRRRF